MGECSAIIINCISNLDWAVLSIPKRNPTSTHRSPELDRVNGTADGRDTGHRCAFLVLMDHEPERLAREAKAVEAKKPVSSEAEDNSNGAGAGTL